MEHLRISLSRNRLIAQLATFVRTMHERQSLGACCINMYYYYLLNNCFNSCFIFILYQSIILINKTIVSSGAQKILNNFRTNKNLAVLTHMMLIIKCLIGPVRLSQGSTMYSFFEKTILCMNEPNLFQKKNLNILFKFLFFSLSCEFIALFFGFPFFF